MKQSKCIQTNQEEKILKNKYIKIVKAQQMLKTFNKLKNTQSHNQKVTILLKKKIESRKKYDFLRVIIIS